jgi:hypothetical protein
MSKRYKKHRYSKKSVAESKAKSLKAIGIIRDKLEDISNKPYTDQSTEALEANLALSINKASIELTSRGTAANKASDWSRKPSRNKSRLQ